MCSVAHVSFHSSSGRAGHVFDMSRAYRRKHATAKTRLNRFSLCPLCLYGQHWSGKFTTETQRHREFGPARNAKDGSDVLSSTPKALANSSPGLFQPWAKKA